MYTYNFTMNFTANYCMYPTNDIKVLFYFSSYHYHVSKYGLPPLTVSSLSTITLRVLYGVGGILWA